MSEGILGMSSLPKNGLPAWYSNVLIWAPSLISYAKLGVAKSVGVVSKPLAHGCMTVRSDMPGTYIQSATCDDKVPPRVVMHGNLSCGETGS